MGSMTSSFAGSDSGYSSGDGNSAGHPEPTTTVSGKPRRMSSAGKRRVTIMQAPHASGGEDGSNVALGSKTPVENEA
jgi:hypothetical protein